MHWGNACLHKREDEGFPIKEGGLPVLYLSYRGIKEKRISRVATSIGTLVTDEGILLGCIHGKNFRFHVYWFGIVIGL